MIRQYLPVEREDERYCNGCPCLKDNNWCLALNTYLLSFAVMKLDKSKKYLAPPNCPLVKSKPEGVWITCCKRSGLD